MNKFEFIASRLTTAELLAQLAEEAAELTHAALKLRRKFDATNPTPVTMDEALENLKEELADVKLLVTIIGFDEFDAEIYDIMRAKLERWVQRLKEV